MALARGEDRSGYQKGRQSWSRDAFGFTKFTEGVTFEDATAVGNWETLKKQGKIRGAYHFFHPALSAFAQAAFFVDRVKAAGGYGPGDIFIADVEVLTGPDGVETCQETAHRRMHLPLQELRGPGLADLTVGSAALAFLDAVRGLVGEHNPVVLYTDLFYAENYLGSCRAYPLFVADYSGQPNNRIGQFPDWLFWQSAAGGGQGGGDTDYFHENEDGLRAWHKSYLPKPPPSGLPAWQKAIYGKLPQLQEGMGDAPGDVSWVRQAQLLLGIEGERVTVDGVFGTSTGAAVKTVQGQHSISRTGVVDGETWAILASGAPEKELPNLGGGQVDGHGAFQEVHRAQALCNAHGVPLTIDGSYGPNTTAAVRSIQHAYGVTGTGTVDKETWSLLLAHAKP